MNKSINIRFGIIALLVLVAALSRLLPHPYNFTPIGAMGLFGAAYFSKRYLAFLVPFAAMWVSDLILNNVVYAKMYPEFYNGFQWWGHASVYLSFGVIVMLGFVLLRKARVVNVLIASLLASIVFFLITNFAVWMGSPMYPQNAVGLIACYAAGLPFFGNTLLGDLFYSGVLFGAFELLKVRFPKLVVIGE